MGMCCVIGGRGVYREDEGMVREDVNKWVRRREGGCMVKDVFEYGMEV